MLSDRIKTVRKTANLTQDAFAAKIGVSKSTISRLESGTLTATSEPVILNICREFNVNSVWLRTGEGEPFHTPQSDQDKVIDVLLADEDETTRTVFKTLAAMGGEEWKTFKDFIMKLAHGIEESEQKKE